MILQHKSYLYYLSEIAEYLTKTWANNTHFSYVFSMSFYFPQDKSRK